MGDQRLEWIKDVVYRFLSIDINEQAFDDLLKRDDTSLNVLQDLFSGPKNSNRCVFFYYNTVEEEIESDEDVLEEPPSETIKVEASHSSESVKSESVRSSISSAAAKAEEKVSVGEDDTDEDESKETDDVEYIADQKDSPKISRTSLRLIVKKTKLYVCLNITSHFPSRSYVYFLLRKLEPIPAIDTFEEALGVMPRYFDLGCISQHPLICIDKMISSLYIPLFSGEKQNHHMCKEHYAINRKQLTSLLSDFNKEMIEFTDSTKQIIYQIDKPFMFSLPSIPENCELEELAKETEFVAEAEDMRNEWSGILSDLYQEVSLKKPPEYGLLHEIDFWKAQKLKLSICWDQLSHSSVQRTIEILKLTDSDMSGFESSVRNLEFELNKVTDNVDYLMLMERNAKNLVPGVPFDESKKALFDVFTVLKIVWVQSDYYRNTENMLRLLRGISILLKERVETDARNDTLFREPLVEVSRVVKESIDILKYWKELYLTESEEVKKYGGTYWWRFDIRDLFDDTDYMISVCTDLGKVTKTLQELHNIFKTNIRFFVEDSKRHVTMENRIFGMTALIQYAEFSIFDPKCKPDWDRIMYVFFRDIRSFENELKSYIGQMFQSSLTWENAYLLSKSFDKYTVSPSIKEFIVKSRADMLKQFVREISETENNFLAHGNDPPQFERIPATASAILWARDLLIKIRKPISEIFDNDIMSKKDMEVMKHFKKTEQLLTAYQMEKFEAWKVESKENLNRFLQANLLEKFKLPSSKFIKTTRLEEAVSYKVNFPIFLEEVSIGAKILEPLGYDIPSFVKNVVLQEAIFYKQRNELTLILEELKTSISLLKREEISVLGIPIYNLCSILDLGVNQIQWETTHIPEFLQKSKQAIDVFKGLVAQIQYIFQEIEIKIKLLSTCELFEFTAVEGRAQTCEEFFGDAEMKLENKVTKMVKIYTSLEPLLRKLESVSSKTSTGKAKQLREYYYACEEKVLGSLKKMMMSNLEYFKDEILEHFIFPYADVAYKSTNELITSSIIRIKLVFVSFMKNAIESTRRLIRWLDGTCIQSSPFYLMEKKLQVEFSYYLDLSLHPQIKNLTLSIVSKFFDYVDKIKFE